MKKIKYFIRDFIRFTLRPKGYTYIRFLITHKYYPNLKKPKTFSEKLIHRKFTRESRELSRFVDKFTVRKYVKETVGEQFLIPIIKSVTYLRVNDFTDLPSSFVMKTSNGGGGENVLIVEDKATLDLEKLCETFNAYLNIKAGKAVDEHFYDIEVPRIIFEELIKHADGALPSDYKLHVFNGKQPKVIVQVDADRFSCHKRSIFDENLNRLPFEIQPKYDSIDNSYKFPDNMNKLIDIAKKLAGKFKYVRVDLYNVDGDIYFGELTFCHGSGWEPISSKKADDLLGSYWEEYE